MLNVRRIEYCEVSEDGDKTARKFGVLAQTEDQTLFVQFENFDEMNSTINDNESILAVVDPEGIHFPQADHEKIGWDNFEDDDWMSDFDGGEFE